MNARIIWRSFLELNGTFFELLYVAAAAPAGDDPAPPDLFFTAVREHHRLVEPTFEITPTFLWYWDAFPTTGGWSYLDAAGRDVELIRTDVSMGSWRIDVAALELRTFLADAGRDLLVQMDYTMAIDHEDFERVDHRFDLNGHSSPGARCIRPASEEGPRSRT